MHDDFDQHISPEELIDDNLIDEYFEPYTNEEDEDFFGERRDLWDDNSDDDGLNW